MRTILFICTGNTCRSPMAEALAREHLRGGKGRAWGDIFVASAGVAASDGMPTTAETLTALERLGISHDGRSKPLTAEMIRKADAVLGMTGGHVAAARALVAGDVESSEKIHRLDTSGDIPDPIGMGQEAYDALAARLQELIPVRLREVLQDASGARL